MRPLQLIVLLALASAVYGAQSYNRTVSTSTIYTGNVAVPGNLSMFSPLPVSFNISDSGTAAYSNVLVEISITGPSSFNTSFYANPLSPGQDETVYMLVPNVTSSAGTYSVYVNSSYILNGTKYRSGAGAQFSVFPSRYAVLPGITSGHAMLQGANLTYLPLFSSTRLNATSLSQIGVQSTSQNSTLANFSVPSEFNDIIKFSTALLYVRPGETLDTSMLFTPPPSTSPQAYLIPVTIKLQSQGIQPNRQTYYVDFYTMPNPSNGPSMYPQAYLSNNTGVEQGTLQIYAPATFDLSGATAQLLISKSVAASPSGISALGAQGSTSQQSGKYVLDWRIGSVPAGSSKYLYYSISGVANVSALRSAQAVLISTGKVSMDNVFKLVSSDLPAFYSNTIGNVTVTLQYTGSVPDRLYISLTGPLGSTISDASRAVNATPNERITERFEVNPGATAGTAILTLRVAGTSANATYSLPIVVLQGSAPPVQQQSQLPALPPFIIYVVLSIIVVIGIAVIYRRLPHRRKVYRRRRADELKRMRDQIKGYKGK